MDLTIGLLCASLLLFGEATLAKELMMGNEAIARGALEAGVRSNSISRNAKLRNPLYPSKWAKEGLLYAVVANEKVALSGSWRRLHRRQISWP